MRHVPRTLCRASAIVLLTLSAAATAIAGGPPWISVEAPVDPLNHAAPGAAMLVHVYSCGAPSDSPIEGVAEGLANGARQSVAIKLKPTGTLGVYAIDQQWPAEGTWVLALTLPKLSPTTTLVQLGPNGGVETDRYYTETTKKVTLTSVRVFGRRLTSEEIEATLRSAPSGVASLPSNAEQRPNQAWLATVVGAPILIGGLFAFGRRRRRD